MDSDLQKLSLLPKSWDDKFSKQRSHVIKVLPCRLGCYTTFPGHIKQIHATRLLVINNYLMHLAYVTSLSHHVSHTKLWGSFHILWEGECFRSRLQKILSCQQHSTSTCLICTPHSQTLLTMHKEFQMQFDFGHC